MESRGTIAMLKTVPFPVAPPARAVPNIVSSEIIKPAYGIPPSLLIELGPVVGLKS